MKTLARRTSVLLVTFIVFAILFMFFNTGNNLDYVIPKRFIRLITLILVGVCVGYSSLIFQTITSNKILTPSIMGYEAVFILFQTILVFLYGDKTFQVISDKANFIYAMLFMMLFSVLIYFLLFKKGKNNIYQLLLIGLVLGTLFDKISQFVQIILDPNEFSMVESHMFVSFNRMNTELLTISLVITALTLIFAQRYLKYLDVIALGRDQAINLGLNYNRLIQIYMLIISVLVSVSTALVGPIVFLGILVTNICYELFATCKHTYMVWLTSVIACIVLFIGQLLVEHVFNFSTTTSIIVNFIGGVYFIYLILQSTQKK